MTNTLKAEIDQRRQMLLETERNWQSGKITSVEFIELAREFTDSIISLFREYVEGIENPHYPSSNEETEYYGFAEAISKVMEGL